MKESSARSLRFIYQLDGLLTKVIGELGLEEPSEMFSKSLPANNPVVNFKDFWEIPTRYLSLQY